LITPCRIQGLVTSGGKERTKKRQARKRASGHLGGRRWRLGHQSDRGRGGTKRVKMASVPAWESFVWHPCRGLLFAGSLPAESIAAVQFDADAFSGGAAKRELASCTPFPPLTRCGAKAATAPAQFVGVERNLKTTATSTTPADDRQGWLWAFPTNGCSTWTVDSDLLPSDVVPRSGPVGVFVHRQPVANRGPNAREKRKS